LAHASYFKKLHGRLQLSLLAIVEVCPGISFQGLKVIAILGLENFPQEFDCCSLLFVSNIIC
jgi:hypothetical protein